MFRFEQIKHILMAVKEKIKPTPIEERKSFIYKGFNFEFLAYNPATDLYLYELTKKAETGNTYDGKIHYFEIVRAVKRNVDGKVINTYPNAEQFGGHQGKCTRYLYKAILYFINGI